MNTTTMALRDFLREQQLASETLGFDLATVEQGTDEWHLARAGVISASNAKFLLQKRDALTRQAYIGDLVASIATMKIKDDIKAWHLEWGKKHEADARDAYSARTFETIDEIAFIYKDNSMRAGCSPDGLIRGMGKGLELKCPASSGVWAQFAGTEFIKPDEIKQIQFCIMVTGYSEWAVAKYDPRNVNCTKLHTITVKRDEAMIKKLEVGLTEMIEDMDTILAKIGLEFGMQWQSVEEQPETEQAHSGPSQEQPGINQTEVSIRDAIFGKGYDPDGLDLQQTFGVNCLSEFTPEEAPAVLANINSWPAAQQVANA